MRLHEITWKVHVNRNEKNFGTYTLGDSSTEVRKMRGDQQRKRSTSIWEGGEKTNQVKKLFQGERAEQCVQCCWEVGGGGLGIAHWI